MQPQNLLLIVSDQHDPRYMGCSGNQRIYTPHLDRLAARGTRFANAWTPCPICVPARASLATGRYVHEIGYWDNALAYDGQVRGWGHELIDCGVRTESIGKLHFTSESAPTGFSRQHDPMHIMDGIGLLWGSVRDPLPEKVDRPPLYHPIGAGESSYNRYDRHTIKRAIAWLEDTARASDSMPWLLQIGLVAPHMPLIVPQKFLDLYPVDSISLPKLMPRDGYHRHPWLERMAKFWDHDEALATDSNRRLAIASYFGLITFLDDLLGQLLAAVERLRLDTSTRIIYTADHGENLGARGVWNKGTMYRESTGIPLIMAGSGVPEHHVSRTNVSLVDLYPTILDNFRLLHGDMTRPGRSLLDLATRPDDPDRIGFSEFHALGAQSGAYMITRGRFKYHFYVDLAPELFDTETDFAEERDLAADAAYARVVAECEAELRRIVDPEATDRRAKDAQNALVMQHGGPTAALRLGNAGATPPPAKFH